MIEGSGGKIIRLVMRVETFMVKFFRGGNRGPRAQGGLKAWSVQLWTCRHCHRLTVCHSETLIWALTKLNLIGYPRQHRVATACGRSSARGPAGGPWGFGCVC